MKNDQLGCRTRRETGFLGDWTKVQWVFVSFLPTVAEWHVSCVLELAKLPVAMVQAQTSPAWSISR
jgi:hypothetical protein